jgi:N-acetylglucosaminyldiphosphoundecaprenol N-acetyl-beta-D-mannosaminyltransferase
MIAGPKDRSAAVPLRRQLFGLSFDALTMAQAVQRCTDAMAAGEYLSIGVVNAAKVITMRRDERLRRAVADCDMILADGQSIVWASRMLRAPLPERVAGIDLFEQLLGQAMRDGRRVYFLGARPDVLARVLDEVTRRYPALQVAGARDGYFGPGEEAQIAAQIRESEADLLFLGMSSPKKELFEGTWGAATGVRVVHGVGGSFDIMAGLTRRAPVWYQTHGLEWLYRAQQEPLRLGRRYLTTNVSFLAVLAREVVRDRLTRRSAADPSRPAGPLTASQDVVLSAEEVVLSAQEVMLSAQGLVLSGEEPTPAGAGQ